jgi:osmotically-inducible protein OsmY
MYGGDFGREDWERRGDFRGDLGRSDYGSQHGYGSQMGTSGRMGEDYNKGYSGTSYGNTSDMRNRNYMGEDRDRGWWDRTRDEVSSWFGDDEAERRRRMDDQRKRMEEQRTGMHRGKGPRGYQRSTERIREDVCDRLAEDDRLDASGIEVQVQGDEVILTGSVNNREDKRRAEDLVESISGVHNVENRLRVGYDLGSSTSERISTGTIPTSSTTTGSATAGSATMGSSRTTGTETTSGSDRNRNK